MSPIGDTTRTGRRRPSARQFPLASPMTRSTSAGRRPGSCGGCSPSPRPSAMYARRTRLLVAVTARAAPATRAAAHLGLAPDLPGTARRRRRRAWPDSLDAVERGACPWAGALPASARGAWRARPDRARAAELRRIRPVRLAALVAPPAGGELLGERGPLRPVGVGSRPTSPRASPACSCRPRDCSRRKRSSPCPSGEARPLAITSHYFRIPR